ncbi:MAG: DNA translocase FtsK 4TM domain-containing protein, partial [Marinirhabdus sp.]
MLSKQQKIVFGGFFILLGIALLASFTSYFFTWQEDQSEVGLFSRGVETKNWLSTFGSNTAHFFVYRGFGLTSFSFAFLITLTGVYYFFDYAKAQLKRFWFWGLLVMVWFSVFFGFFSST